MAFRQGWLTPHNPVTPRDGARQSGSANARSALSRCLGGWDSLSTRIRGSAPVRLKPDTTRSSLANAYPQVHTKRARRTEVGAAEGISEVQRISSIGDVEHADAKRRVGP